MKIMALIEEQYLCSGGLCSNDTRDMLPIYVFSNVNDGVPTESCHDGLKEYIM